MDWTRTTARLFLWAMFVIAGGRAAHAQYYQTPIQPLPAPADYSIPAGSPNSYALPSSPSPSNTAPAVVTTIDPSSFECYTEASWYTRVDYFHWNEQIEGFDLVNEDGALTTIGYERRIGRERFRAELFGGEVRYDGTAMFSDGSIEPFDSRTSYLGVRGEYELLFQPEFMRRANFFTGLGTRFWIRDGQDGFTDAGDYVLGYQETWWTIYPYLGLEKRRMSPHDIEFFWSSRIGLTAVTYEKAAFSDHPLWPKTGIMTRAELGWRGPRLSVSAVFETMNWGESDVVRGWLQPASSMVTIGLQAGFMF